MWGGATFDVCLRFLHENPWRRLREIRKAAPNILLQMLLRGSNGVGYAAYPDNLIEKFIVKSWENGMDIFRIFDSLNWVKAMAPSIEYVRTKTGGIAEAAISYTGDVLDKNKTKYNLKYYHQLAKDLENAGAHMIAIKDMAGLLTPYAATELIHTIKDATNLPIHLHTHDTSSIQSATYLKAIESVKAQKYYKPYTDAEDDFILQMWNKMTKKEINKFHGRECFNNLPNFYIVEINVKELQKLPHLFFDITNDNNLCSFKREIIPMSKEDREIMYITLIKEVKYVFCLGWENEYKKIDKKKIKILIANKESLRNKNAFPEMIGTITLSEVLGNSEA